MPSKLNRMLMTSLVNEVEELTYLAQEIKNSESLTNTHVEYLTSWKFPSLPAVDVNAVEMLKNCKGSAGEMYLLLLELIYDRIHFVLGIILETIRAKSVDDDTSAGNRQDIINDWRTVPSLVKSIWQELSKRSNSCIAIERRIESLVEARNALTRQLASMAESKIALERTVIAKRAEILELRQQLKENKNETKEILVTDDVTEANRENAYQRVDKNEETNVAASDEKSTREKIANFVVFPEDDPLTDMKKELEANKEKIDNLLRKNDRISKVITRITEYRRIEARRCRL